jgi:hypothetical protein
MSRNLCNAGQRDSVLPVTRWLSISLLPFLAVAFVLLYVWPDRTGQLFAWTIRPDLTAMMLAAAYLGGLFFFGSAVRTARWSEIQNGFLAVLTFATLLGLATVLHWDRFHAGHVSFIAWVSLYLSTPFVVLSVWLVNTSATTGVALRPSHLLPAGWRLVFFGIGLATLAVAVTLWILPTWIVPQWPWALTPLTAKVVGAMFSLPGMVGIAIARDGRWDRARVLVRAQGLSIGAILVAVVRDSDAVDWSRPAAWFFVGGLSLNLVLYAALPFSVKSSPTTDLVGSERV